MEDGQMPAWPGGAEQPAGIAINGPCTNGFIFGGNVWALAGRDFVGDNAIVGPGPGWSQPRGSGISCGNLGKPGDYVATFSYYTIADDGAGTLHRIDRNFRVRPIKLGVSPSEIAAGGSVSISVADVVTQGAYGELITKIEVRCPNGATSSAVALSLQVLNTGTLSSLTFPGASFTGACTPANTGTYLVRLTSPHQQVTQTFDVVGDRDNDGINDAEDNCPDDPNPSQENDDNDSLGNACDPDFDTDQDGIPNDGDNCPDDANPGQDDDDEDGLGNECDPNPSDRDNDDVDDALDNCPDNFNPLQDDADHNGVGDACEPDIDGDGIPNQSDNCPADPNPGQEENDLIPDGFGDVCDPPDGDGDTIPNVDDNCPQVENFDQHDSNGDGQGDACDDDDTDGDSVPDASDNCPAHPNPSQTDSDSDGVGDVCETEDPDGDGLSNFEDNCPFDFNPGQFDQDNDGIGDLCDFDNDTDGDGLPDPLDNCPFAFNPGQEDANGNGAGDACDTPVDSDGDGLSDAEEGVLGTDPNSPTSYFDGINTYSDGQPTGTSNPATSGDAVGVAIDPPDNVDSVGVAVTDPNGETAYEGSLTPQSPVVFSFMPDMAGDWKITAELYNGEDLVETLIKLLSVKAGSGPTQPPDNSPGAPGSPGFAITLPDPSQNTSAAKPKPAPPVPAPVAETAGVSVALAPPYAGDGGLLGTPVTAADLVIVALVPIVLAALGLRLALARTEEGP
jgi:hypothetical protein